MDLDFPVEQRVPSTSYEEFPLRRRDLYIHTEMIELLLFCSTVDGFGEKSPRLNLQLDKEILCLRANWTRAVE